MKDTTAIRIHDYEAAWQKILFFLPRAPCLSLCPFSAPPVPAVCVLSVMLLVCNAVTEERMPVSKGTENSQTHLSPSAYLSAASAAVSFNVLPSATRSCCCGNVHWHQRRIKTLGSGWLLQLRLITMSRA